MKIDRLDGGTILVTMEREDMRDYRLDLHRQDGDETQRALTRLLYRVGEVCGLDHRGKSYLIEALPGHDGCLLIISVHAARRRVWRVKRGGTTTACIFDSADALLDWMNADKGRLSCYSVYRCRAAYVLIPGRGMTAPAAALLSEYGTLSRLGTVALARVCEYGERVLETRAPRQLSKSASSAAI